MNKSLEIILNFRRILLSRIESLTTEQLNAIPVSYNNNIIWNLAHMNAVMQNLCYTCSGLPITIDEKYFQRFMPLTKPEGFIGDAEVLVIKTELISSVEKLNKDLEDGIFQSYTEVERIRRVYNIGVSSIDDAIRYTTHHEGIHFNAVLNMKRMLGL